MVISESQRPELTKDLPATEFKRYYWEKKELAQFCRQHKLYSGDGKLEITARIEKFLANGIRDNPVVKKITKGNWDSEKFNLTLDTVVVNYKSDPVTRHFFQDHIGKHFHFNARVLTWIKQKSQQGDYFTYRDIMQRWLEEEAARKDPNLRKDIPEQFQYNRFTQAWANAGAGKGVKAAWNALRQFPGEATYEHYIKLREQRKIVDDPAY